MRCTNCGTDADGRFCRNCGAPLPEQPMTEGQTKAAQNKPKKPFFKRVWVWVLIVIVAISIIVGSCGGKSGNGFSEGFRAGMEAAGNTPEQITENAAEPAPQAAVAAMDAPVAAAVQKEATEPEEDLSQVETVYELGAGHYTVGIDIPAGKCDIAAIKGRGNVSSSNLYSGGINEIFGKDDGTGFYTESFAGLKLSKDVVLSIGGSAVVKLEYTKITGGYSGRTYDEAGAITLSSGNYEAGSDFDAGVYTIAAVSGNGNISSTNLFNGGINEIFGDDDGTGFYIERVENVALPAGTELSVSGGVTVKLIPSR